MADLDNVIMLKPRNVPRPQGPKVSSMPWGARHARYLPALRNAIQTRGEIQRKQGEIEDEGSAIRFLVLARDGVQLPHCCGPGIASCLSADTVSQNSPRQLLKGSKVDATQGQSCRRLLRHSVCAAFLRILGRYPAMAKRRRLRQKVKPEEDEPEQEEADDEEHEEELEEEPADLDIDAIAEKAVSIALKASSRTDPGQLKLDLGLGPEQLYLTGTGDSAFDTSALAGQYQASASDLCRSQVHKVPVVLHSQDREVRGAHVRPVNDAKERKAEAKKERTEKLEKWFGLPKHRMTPELEKELTALKLRANFDPKRFYKANDRQQLPKYFTIATEVGGGMAPVGLHTKTREVHAHSGRSFLDTILRDETVQAWTQKKKSEVSEKQAAALRSGHGKRKSEGAKSTKRGGSWKQLASNFSLKFCSRCISQLGIRATVHAAGALQKLSLDLRGLHVVQCCRSGRSERADRRPCPYHDLLHFCTSHRSDALMTPQHIAGGRALPYVLHVAVHTLCAGSWNFQSRAKMSCLHF